jgi:hypothetical protein
MIKTRHVSELPVGDYARLSEDYTAVRCCALCGADYKELHNLGRLCCRVHPGVLRLDQHYAYSCCRREWGSRGCVRCDHVETELPASEDERHAELERMAIKAVPTVLYEYGVTRPLNEAVLWHQQRRLGNGSEAGAFLDEVGGTVVQCALPFGVRLEHSVGVMARALSDSIVDSPLLSHVYGRDEQGAEHRRMLDRINQRWPENCAKQEDGPPQVNDSRSGVISRASLHIIPFVVLCRLKV